MRLAGLLRLTAVGIALMCWLDPASSVAPPPPVLVEAAVVGSSRDRQPVENTGTETVADVALQLAAQLSRELGRDGDLRLHRVTAGDSLPCDAVRPCVVITDGAALQVPPDRQRAVSIIHVGAPLSPNSAITRTVVHPAHLSGQASATVFLSGLGLTGRRSRVRLYDGEAVVGESIHEWTADGDATVDVPWSPLAGGTRTLQARVTTDGVEERSDVDDSDTAQAVVTSERWPIAVFERRASWSASFIRRALEADNRFVVAAQSAVAPRIDVATSDAGVDLARLDEVRVVLVGAPEALTSEDVSRLERFVRDRGGAVILAPDRPFGGPVTRLLHHPWREQRDDEAVSAGPLLAREWLLAGGVTPLDRVWASSARGPVVVATQTGAGMVMVSGAMDAWRHRAADGAYDRFWRATVAGLAMAAGPPVALTLAGHGTVSANDLDAHVTARTMRAVDSWQVSAVRLCDDGERVPLRLWPGDGTGMFEGRLPVGTRTGCTVEVSVPGVGTARETLPAAARNSSPRWTRAEMDTIASKTGGVVIRDGDLAPLVRAWRDQRGSERRAEPRHPMRTWWWFVPLVICLGGDWWLRRRAGLR